MKNETSDAIKTLGVVIDFDHDYSEKFEFRLYVGTDREGNKYSVKVGLKEEVLMELRRLIDNGEVNYYDDLEEKFYGLADDINSLYDYREMRIKLMN